MQYFCKFYALRNLLEVKFGSLEGIIMLKTIKHNVKTWHNLPKVMYVKMFCKL